ncbi:MAG: hypothetical protein ACMUJI_02205 [Erythrobacter sp.]|uniref:hypothetical protein n=1 Tax=Erythrobacter sp. TaxID=1042 RepID=UPI003A83FC2E
MNEANRLNLDGRAALSVPLIAIVAALFLAAFEWALRTDNSMFDGPALFKLVFVYTAIIALPAGAFLAVPMLIFGGRLPQPRWLWLAIIGLCVGIGLSILLAGGFDPRGTAGLGLMGLICGLLWWLCVERFREEPVYD